MSGIGNAIKHLGGFMTNIKSSASPTTIATVAVVLVALLGAGYYYFVFRKRHMESFEYSINREPSTSSDSGKQAELLFFFANWCPHCVKAKPEWESALADSNGKTINGYAVKFKEIDCTSETSESEKMIDKYKVEGYPTIKLIKDGQVIEYDAKVTKSTIEEFLNTML
jgi:thiol-disulfide isomerase/thioredoxin